MKPRIPQISAGVILATLSSLALGVFPADAATRSAFAAYNDGVGRMGKNELREAESALREAVSANDARVQPAALYNLGHVRFLQGKETLKGEGNRQQLLDSVEAAKTVAEEAIRRGVPIAEGNDLQALVGAYMEARAARKQIRLSKEANTRQLDLLGSAIKRWRRSVGDFRSAHELNPANTDAAYNADIVERHIAELFKFQKQMEMEQEGLSEMREKLTEMMKKMRGKIPKEMQRGSDDEEDDEEDEPQDPQEAQKQAGKQQEQRIGGEREIDPDMLRVLKERMPQRTMSFGQDGDQERPGPDGQRPGEPRNNRKGRDW